MKLLDVMQEASRRGEFPRLNRTDAKRVLQAMVQYFEQKAIDQVELIEQLPETACRAQNWQAVADLLGSEGSLYKEEIPDER